MILNLVGCLGRYIPGTTPSALKKRDEQSKAIAEKILDSLVKNDREAFKALFTKQAQNQSDFYLGEEYTFALL